MNPPAREAGSAVRRRRLLEVLLLQAIGLEAEDARAFLAALEPVAGALSLERICTFLGHPDHCPHDKPIPQGECCRALALGNDGEIQPILPLSELEVGDTGEIVLIRPRHPSRLERLGAYGVVPGSRLHLHQKRPAYVVQVGETDLALDREVARDIFVREIRPRP
jgi:DtxR family Mn-dependent transcriptional regulator